MTRHNLFIVMASLLMMVFIERTFADSPSLSSQGGTAPQDSLGKDTRTDLTGGQSGIPDEYANTPVRQGALKEVQASRWLNQSVTNKQGETLGRITKLLSDEKTQQIEYAVLEIAGTHQTNPMLWSRFEPQGNILVLNATKEELIPTVSSKNSKDLSPDLSGIMKEVEVKRAEPKPMVGAGDGRGVNSSVPSTGTLGEDSAAGELGPRSAPPGGAPGYEGDDKKR